MGDAKKFPCCPCYYCTYCTVVNSLFWVYVLVHTSKYIPWMRSWYHLGASDTGFYTFHRSLLFTKCGWFRCVLLQRCTLHVRIVLYLVRSTYTGILDTFLFSSIETLFCRTRHIYLYIYNTPEYTSIYIIYVQFSIRNLFLWARARVQGNELM